MDVNTSLYSSRNTSSNINITHTTKSHTTNADSSTQPNASTATDSYTSSNSEQVKGLYSKPKKLTDDQVKALKDAQNESQKQFIQKLAESLFTKQGTISNSSSSQNSTNALSDLLATFSEDIHLPKIVTDPEEAEKALVGDGPYSVNSVATRIMDIATSLAGNNPEKLELMRHSVIKGFENAGMTFSKTTGENKLPQICLDTYDEIIKRFDVLHKNM